MHGIFSALVCVIHSLYTEIIGEYVSLEFHMWEKTFLISHVVINESGCALSKEDGVQKMPCPTRMHVGMLSALQTTRGTRQLDRWGC